jgi:Peroxiredoxin
MIVGSLAPAFSTNAYTNGQIKNISLQDYMGKWVILFFYSGDFTFV